MWGIVPSLLLLQFLQYRWTSYLGKCSCACVCVSLPEHQRGGFRCGIQPDRRQQHHHLWKVPRVFLDPQRGAADQEARHLWSTTAHGENIQQLWERLIITSSSLNAFIPAKKWLHIKVQKIHLTNWFNKKQMHTLWVHLPKTRSSNTKLWEWLIITSSSPCIHTCKKTTPHKSAKKYIWQIDSIKNKCIHYESISQRLEAATQNFESDLL